jgi:two-component system chemotaxis response regulator CheY
VPHNILIVDDSATTRAVIKRLIHLCGIDANVLEACDGNGALDMLGTCAIELVLADLHMPNMGGVELTQRMSGDPRLRNVPVVIISADPNAHRIDQLKQQGVRGYLAKPFTPERFRDVLGQLLGTSNHA